jgi:hypothetical protein
MFCSMFIAVAAGLSGEIEMAIKNISEGLSGEAGAATGTATAKAQQQTQPGGSAVPPQPKAGGPTEQEIARRAYELWAARGGTPGDPVEDWLLAERQLREGTSSDAGSRGCTTSFLLQERDEIGQVCAVEPDPQKEYVQPEGEKEAGGEG